MSMHEDHLAHLTTLVVNGSHLLHSQQHGGVNNMHEIAHSEHTNSNNYMGHTGMKFEHTSADSSCSVHTSHAANAMTMTFHGGFCEVVLFDAWKISSLAGLVGSIIGIVIMAALYEGLKYYREYLFWKTYNALQYRSVSMPQEKTNDDNRIIQPTMLSWMHAFQTLLHITQIMLSYFLMLIFMTYNSWLCAAVILGAALGYFLFGWKKSVIVDVTEHCH
ncbi:high affinity copper uptake protein 1-like [Phymastichus coffea]|uniref:high affinity copper uptake protein 1-like n=1 Tax=Phymastichus coffea TaxID=108790 RepID=UPI00273C2E56|nr:high affinity copper uptake protein 1-like [Phymastichus coffea]XP_058795679.1 high affinity copper uptake protein 1-like [Phymastichus coffea]